MILTAVKSSIGNQALRGDVVSPLQRPACNLVMGTRLNSEPPGWALVALACLFHEHPPFSFSSNAPLLFSESTICLLGIEGLPRVAAFQGGPRKGSSPFCPRPPRFPGLGRETPARATCESGLKEPLHLNMAPATNP